MPCDTVTVQRIDLRNAMADILKDAVQKCGFTVTASDGTAIVARKGMTRFRWQKGSEAQLENAGGVDLTGAGAEITRAYSRAAVTWAAKRAGWAVTAVAGDVNRFVVQKR